MTSTTVKVQTSQRFVLLLRLLHRIHRLMIAKSPPGSTMAVPRVDEITHDPLIVTLAKPVPPRATCAVRPTRHEVLPSEVCGIRLRCGEVGCRTVRPRKMARPREGPSVRPREGPSARHLGSAPPLAAVPGPAEQAQRAEGAGDHRRRDHEALDEEPGTGGSHKAAKP